MARRDQLAVAAPWLLAGCSLALLGTAVFLRMAGDRDAAAEETLAAVFETAGFASFPVVGAVIAARLPANPYGWVWCAAGVAYGVLALSSALVAGHHVTGWPVTAVGNVGYVLLAGLLVFVFLLFPTGRLPGRGWVWLSRATVALGALLLAATPFAPSLLDTSVPAPWTPPGAAGRLLTDLVLGATLGLLALVVVAMASVAPRYRRAGPVERQQLKWFLLATAVNAGYVLADFFVVGAREGSPVWTLVGALTVSLIPVAVAIAVLRYRLYEVDRIISRSVSYALLTGALVALYLLLVALLRPLLEPVTGGSDLAVAGSTLAVAAVFNPARRRLQDLVDRRFDRARYDAARAVDAFAARLRGQVDLDEVTAGLRDTVAATVAPGRVGIWLRAPAQTRGRAP